MSWSRQPLINAETVHVDFKFPITRLTSHWRFGGLHAFVQW